ncbi:MAG: AsmA family protein [Enterobacteriaceae bacterium]
MRWLSKILITLVLLLILSSVVLYFVMQTQTGANWISRWVSWQTGYQVSAAKIEYRFPMQFQVQDLSLSVDNQPVVVSKSALLDFAFASWLRWPKLQTLTLQQGTLNLTDMALPLLPVRAEQLQLKKIALNWRTPQWQLSGTDIDAGISPWAPTMENLLAKESRFEVSADRVHINGTEVNKLFLRGALEKGLVVVQDFGADIAQGALTGKARQQADRSWRINNMQLSNVRWQTDKTVHELWQESSQWPDLYIDRFDLLDARMEGSGWAFNDLNISTSQVVLKQGKLSAQQGSVNLSAGNFIVNSLALTDPVARLQLSPNGIEIKQFSTHWQNSLIRTQGRWQRNNRELQLDSLEMAGLEYTLPLEWYRLWRQPLPDWLKCLSITKFTGNNNLLIAIDPLFPFQLTQLGGYGSQLLLADNRQLGFWQGQLSLNAFDATFNKVDLRRPEIKLQATSGQLTASEWSALVHSGLLEGKVEMTLTGNQPFHLSAAGRSVELALLKQWGWGTGAIQDVGSFQLQLKGEAAAQIPFQATLHGTLQAQGEKGNYHQVMQAGVVEHAPAGETP